MRVRVLGKTGYAEYRKQGGRRDGSVDFECFQGRRRQFQIFRYIAVPSGFREEIRLFSKLLQFRRRYSELRVLRQIRVPNRDQPRGITKRKLLQKNRVYNAENG